MIPKKKRRKIIVKDVLYYYSIGYYPTIFVENSITKKTIKWMPEYDDDSYWRITPLMVRDLIIERGL